MSGPLDGGFGDPNEPIEVVADWGFMLIADTSDICVPGISCGARGLAVLARGLGRTPTVAEVVELTGDHPIAIEGWLRELAGTEYLFWED